MLQAVEGLPTKRGGDSLLNVLWMLDEKAYRKLLNTFKYFNNYEEKEECDFFLSDSRDKTQTSDWQVE